MWGFFVLIGFLKTCFSSVQFSSIETLQLNLPPPHPVKKALCIFRNWKLKLPSYSSTTPAIYFEQPQQPTIITEQERAHMLEQVDIEYRELFDSMS